MNEHEAMIAFLSGIRVHESAMIPEFQESHRQERKWANRVKYQRYRRFDIEQGRVVISMNGELYCHPNTLSVILKAAAKESLK